MPRRSYRRSYRNRASRIAIYVQIARDSVLGLAALGAYVAYVEKDIIAQATGLAAIVGVMGFGVAVVFVFNRIRRRR